MHRAYIAHLFTATGILCSFYSLIAIDRHAYLIAFAANGLAILIDSIDGLLARKLNVKKNAPLIDGALMDNIIDYTTYTFVPVFLLYKALIIPYPTIALSAILLSSIINFSNNNAKTPDHFFLGFPSYWNLIVFYLFIWQLPPMYNAIIIWICVILAFIPIKFIYPSRIDHLKPAWTKTPFTVATLLWGLATLLLFLTYPHPPFYLHLYTLFYIVLYTGLSLHQTL